MFFVTVRYWLTDCELQVLNGAERGEPVALLLSPLKPSLENPSSADDTAAALNGSQFTFFLTAPLQAFCQMLGLSNSDPEPVSYLILKYICKT